MEFLVYITVQWPPDGDDAARTRLMAEEMKRADELVKQGVLRRLWRVPGEWANVGLWSAPDATTLHEAIASLPLFLWLRVKVQPLASHPSDPGQPPGATSEWLSSQT